MRLTDEERPCWRATQGPARQWAIKHQIAVGEFFDAPDFVPVGQAHIMADTESLGEAGVAWLEELAALPEPQRRVRIPTITDPRGLDFDSYKRLKQTDAMADLEARAIAAFEALGVLMTNTCINYQTILPPVRGEHLAFGDTGVVIYSNSVMGARSNFEGGPSALSAGLTGRTPRYGYHLDAHRGGTRHFDAAPPAARSRRLGRARRHRRQGHQQLLGGAGRHGPRGGAQFRRAQALRRGAGELRLGGAVPHAGRDAGGADAGRCVRGPRHSRRHRDRQGRLRGVLRHLCGARRQGRRGGVRRAAAVADRDAAGGRPARRPAHPRRHVAGRHHLARDQVRRRPHGADAQHRGRRRHRRRGRVLLPELCARDGGGQRLAAPAHQLGQAGQHHRRLRLQADAGQHGTLHRQRVRGGSCDANAATVIRAVPRSAIHARQL